ncbi:glycoside hydrolase family 127 protein [Pseudochryseolinea flava]|uniref:Glycoside hydrolase family 127 protein n=1 Tax=Pseudochryseolinea flava TaxID=2059302 RepID=A0A364Y7P8_9BACT|nr:glycoside hydrolase family 127 protein [Pseudochryseolinea flava]RAW02281.1 glycoside hydrolase family 127 protein [Pseudochryseolinea flava]
MVKFSRVILLFFACIVHVACYGQAGELKSGDYPIQPVLFNAVKLNDSFWAPRIKTNHDVTIPFTLGKCYSTGRVKNFEIAAGLKTGKFGTEFTFDDTDVYKIIEGGSYSLQIFKDPVLELKMDSLIDLIGKAQEPDGYIYTNRTIMGDHAHEWAGSKRWEKEAELSHELYNIGHLIEAGIAHYHATGKKTLLNISIKAADRVCADFGPDKLHIFSGHQIIELALAKLYKVTGEKKYLDAAKFLLDVRGPGGDPYNQAHKKVVDQHEAVGHAVRAAYMYAGMADVAALTNDAGYINAIDHIWEDAVYKKIYVTGGIGATGHGEAFGAAYELPNMSAYNETCASIANVYWNYRLFLLHGEAKYFDVLERTLYNAFLSGVALTGDRFFYPNPLESHGQHARSPWFSCACCPSNVTRFVPSVGGYFYAQKENVLYVNLYGQSSVDFTVDKNQISLAQKTNYPWDGSIDIAVDPKKSASAELRLRLPGWASQEASPGNLYAFIDKVGEKVTVKINGKATDFKVDKGYIVLNRKWQKGDHVTLTLPMPVRKVSADQRVAADVDKIAYQRGPLVYCAEWPDNHEKKVLNLVVSQDAKVTPYFDPSFFNGMYLLKASGHAASRTLENGIKTSDVEVKLIPYFTWAHRGTGEMTVWIPAKAAAAQPLPSPTIASTSEITASHKSRTLMALNDQMEPKNSNDQSIIFYHWWPMQDTTQWVQYDFKKNETVSSSKVYWFDDGPFGGCRIPAGWRILYKSGDQWLPVKTKKNYEILKDKFCEVTFEPVTTNAVRLEINLPKEHSSGVMEWSVF